MSESAPEGNRPQKIPSSSKSKSRSAKSRASKSGAAKKSRSAKSSSRRKKKPRRSSKAAAKPRGRKRGERRSRVRLRRVVAGTTYFIAKKTNDDQFFLRPDGSVDAVLLYVLIERLNKYGLLLHGFVFMSNHFHFVVTDRRSKLPDFMRDFVAETGKALKVVLKTTRKIWSSTPYSATELLDRDAAERFIVYAHVNPTEAGQTKPEDWPGLTSARWKIGDTIEAVRPDVYFDPRHRPDRVSCVLEPLPEHFGEATDENTSTLIEIDEEWSDDEETRKEERAKYRRRCAALQKEIDRRTKERVAEILAERKKSSDPSKRGLAGAKKVKKESRSKRGTHPFGGLTPRFASKDPQRLDEAIAAERAFRARHEEARLRYVNGEQGVLFPVGTYGYRERLWVRVRKVGVAA